MQVYVGVGVSHLFSKIVLILLLVRLSMRQVYFAIFILYTSILIGVLFFVLIGPAYKNLIYRES